MTTDPLGARLLAEVLAHPEDLDARLVYADHLLGAGDPRGRFIVEQITLGRMDPADAGYAPLLASTERLLAEHGERWLGDYGAAARAFHASGNFILAEVSEGMNAVYVDGFLERIAVGDYAAAEHWQILAAREPIAGLEVVAGMYTSEDGFLNLPPDLRMLALTSSEMPIGYLLPAIMARGMPLRRLGLGFRLSPAEGAAVWRHLQGVRSLHLRGCEIGDEGVLALFASEALGELDELDLGACDLQSDSLGVLRRDPRLSDLRRLGLGGPPWSMGLRHALASLAGWGTLRGLAHLELPPSTSPEELRSLFPDPSPRLRALDLRGAREVAAAPEAVARVATTLTELTLDSCHLGSDAFARLLESPSLARLVRLSVRDCRLDDEAVDALVRSPLDRLVTLDLSQNLLGPRAARAIAGWPGLAHVTTLRLGRNPALPPSEAVPLVEHPSFTPVRLELDGGAGAATVDALRARFGAAIRARQSGTPELPWRLD